MDAPLFIEGTVSLREEEDPKILVNVIDGLIENGKFSRPPAISAQLNEKRTAVTRKDSPDKTVAPIKEITKIYLRVPDIKGRQYLKAKNIVDIFEGNVKVIFYNSETSQYINYATGLMATEYIVNELRSILGNENVVLR